MSNGETEEQTGGEGHAEKAMSRSQEAITTILKAPNHFEVRLASVLTLAAGMQREVCVRCPHRKECAQSLP